MADFLDKRSPLHIKNRYHSLVSRRASTAVQSDTIPLSPTASDSLIQFLDNSSSKYSSEYPGLPVKRMREEPYIVSPSSPRVFDYNTMSSSLGLEAPNECRYAELNEAAKLRLQELNAAAKKSTFCHTLDGRILRQVLGHPYLYYDADHELIKPMMESPKIVGNRTGFSVPNNT